ncbi:hypothetical protein cyc_00488 [Cyclospora cayetanensis]|uniref:Uncharacterized protein n=1 Tax=Cyclospora cayetanensis TaxID=88456 RepID=A0A1D3D6N2_9EIME|nr:hypothetical protein cyc_00488 [Cyclospora cayetanensis]
MSEVFAVFDSASGESLEGAAPASRAPTSSGERDAAIGFVRRVENLFSPYGKWPPPCGSGGKKAALPYRTEAFRGFLYYSPFFPLRLSHHLKPPRAPGYPCHVKLGPFHHAVHAHLAPPKAMQARLLDVQEKAFVAERLLDFDESFALVHEQLLRRPQFLMALSKHRETGAPLTFSQAAGLGLDLVDLLHPNGALVTAAVDFAIHSLDASKATTQSLEESIRAAIEDVAPYRVDDSFPIFSLDYLRNIEGSYSGALVCYILAEMRALRILQQLEKGPPSRVGPALPDLRAVKRDLLPLHPRGPLPPLMGTSGGAAAGASLVALYSAPKDLQGVECLLATANLNS